MTEVKNHFGTTTAITQLTLTLFMVGLAVGNVVAGTVSDSTGRKKPLIVSLISYIIASIVIALTLNVTVMIVFRLKIVVNEVNLSYLPCHTISTIFYNLNSIVNLSLPYVEIL
ncbi:TPA: MFS transporter [Staphylococcus pseudintermedius]